jgi:hypothetical protein
MAAVAAAADEQQQVAAAMHVISADMHCHGIQSHQVAELKANVVQQ